jgi:hypothetical protein
VNPGGRYKQVHSGREVVILDTWYYADDCDWHYCTVDEFIWGGTYEKVQTNQESK